MMKENVPVDTLRENGLEGVRAAALDHIDERAWVEKDLAIMCSVTVKGLNIISMTYRSEVGQDGAGLGAGADARVALLAYRT